MYHAGLGSFSKFWWSDADSVLPPLPSVDEHLEHFLRHHPQKSAFERNVVDVLSPLGVSTMWLGTYAASLLTPELLRGLVGVASASSALDVGAGGGHAIDVLAASSSPRDGDRIIHATDIAWPVVWRLARKDAVAVAVQTDQDAVAPLDGPGLFSSYDLVFCLNVLDRCMLPVTLLNAIARKVAAGGTAILSVRLPLDAYVWTPRNGIEAQKEGELMDVCLREDFSEGCGAFLNWVEDQSPLRVVRATRWPYLIQGHAEPFTSLDNLVVVVKHA